MISECTLKYLRWFIKGGEQLKITVFTWNDSTGLVGISKSKLTWSILITLETYLLMQSVFEVSQIYRLAGDPEEPLPNYMKLLSQCLSRFLLALFTIDVCMYGENKAAFINQMILLNQRFKTVQGGDMLKDNVKTLAKVINVIAFIYPVLPTSDFLQEWHQSRYWHHLVIPDSIFPFTLPFLGVLEYIITALTAHPVSLYLYLMTVYFRSSSAWLDLVTKMGTTHVTDLKTDRLTMFRTLQVYNQIYNNRMAVMWTYKMAGMFAIQTLCTVISLRMAFVMPFPTNCMFFFGAAVCMFYTTRIYRATTAATIKSQEFADRLKKSGSEYKKKVGASMKPLYVEVRPFFVMTKTTSFSYTNEVVDKTISVLVST